MARSGERPTGSRAGRLLAPAAAVALALVLTGCLFGEVELPFDPDEAVIGSEVLLINNTYEPGAIAVGRNRSVTFRNEDRLRHTVVSGSPGNEDGLFDVLLEEDVGAQAIVFEEAGVFPFFCRLHPSMQGIVVVG